MTEINEKHSYKCNIGIALGSELTSLIDIYKIRLAKIERAVNRSREGSQGKAYKEGAVEQTKRFIKELKRLQKLSIIYMELCDGDCAELISESDIQSQEVKQ